MVKNLLLRKRGALAPAIFVLLVFGLLFFSATVVTVAEQSALYANDRGGPLPTRVVVTTLQPGAEVVVVDCVDTGSDLYLKVRSEEGDVGYLYDVNTSSQRVTFSSTPKTFGAAIRCLLW